MSQAMLLNRRTALAGGVATAIAAIVGSAGCDTAKHASSSPGSTGPVAPQVTSDPSSTAAAETDRALKQRAIADERGLLTACQAPPNQEPFATLRALHSAHLHFLTGESVSSPGTATAPSAATVAALERKASAARRADCVRASPELAPLLASLAASGSVAEVLLSP